MGSLEGRFNYFDEYRVGVDCILVLLNKSPLSEGELKSALFRIWERGGKNIPNYFEFKPWDSEGSCYNTGVNLVLDCLDSGLIFSPAYSRFGYDGRLMDRLTRYCSWDNKSPLAKEKGDRRYMCDRRYYLTAEGEKEAKRIVKRDRKGYRWIEEVASEVSSFF